MPSQGAKAVLALRDADEGARVATLELACGCVVTRTIAADRILETEDGERRAIGKYPCPLDHPVRAPR
jgi:hypothetical protein